MKIDEEKPLRDNNLHGIVYPRKTQVIASSSEQNTSPTHIIYNGGLLIERVEVFSIFWGKEWKQNLGNLSISIDDFFKVILNSEIIDQLAEYNTERYTIKHGKYLGNSNITDPIPTSKKLNDTDIKGFLKKQIFTNRSFPQPTKNMLYFIYLPPGVVSILGTDMSCNEQGKEVRQCAYHNNIDDPQTYYAVIPYPSCRNCFMGKEGDLSPLDALTSLSSHELCEAITDPVFMDSWCDPNTGIEIGDVCETELKNIGVYKVQKEWSNQKKDCI